MMSMVLCIDSATIRNNIVLVSYSSGGNDCIQLWILPIQGVHQIKYTDF